jgi:hypothetical protein
VSIGIEGIHDCSENGILGSNMVEMMKMKNIDRVNVISNNIEQVEKTLGIEAARKVILEELGERPIIADFMTHSGKVYPFSKNNPNLMDKGILTSMTFERFKRDMERLYREPGIDNLNSIYSQSMVGLVPNFGSNSDKFEVISEEDQK